MDRILSMSGLSLERLQTLREIAESGSIVEAARGDANRQSQYSRQIGELEQFFGIELLNRESRPYRLNGEAAELVQITSEYEQKLGDFYNRCRDRPRSLTVGAGDSVFQWLLLPDIEQWQTSLPNVALHFKNLRTLEVIGQLQDGEVDLGVVRNTATLGTSLKTAGSIKFSYRLFVPKRMRKKLPPDCPIECLGDLPLAVLDGKGDFRTRLAELAREAGLELPIQLELSSLPLIANAIKSGRFAGFLPEFAAPLVADRATVHEVVGFELLNRELVFAWHPKKAQSRTALEDAVNFLKRTFP